MSCNCTAMHWTTPNAVSPTASVACSFGAALTVESWCTVTKFNEVTLGHYQEVARSTAIYPEAGDGRIAGMMYATLGLAGEAGELANKVKKLYRDGYNPDFYERAAAELGDVLWYVAMMATELGYNLDDIAQHNMTKLKDRAARGKLGGSGDER